MPDGADNSNFAVEFGPASATRNVYSSPQEIVASLGLLGESCNR
jgi:hypothetical protein